MGCQHRDDPWIERHAWEEPPGLQHRDHHHPLFISEYLINWIIFSEVLAENGQGQPVLFLPLDFFSFIRNSIEMEPITILYWAIAVIFPFARLQHKEKEPSDEEPDESPQELPTEFNKTV